MVSRPQASPDFVHQSLTTWLSNARVFVRPNLGNLAMVDADKYKGALDTLYGLQPRCLAEISPGNYQLWLTLGEHLGSKSALEVTKDLSRALGADMASAKTTQAGRLPGSINVKAGKGNRILLLHACLQDLNEKAFLKLVPDPPLYSEAKSRAQATTSVATTDRSREDWRMACKFFEEHADATSLPRPSCKADSGP